jgi:ABC-type uncharacterized transport system involved in gliding motility auxiliary subunit
MKRYAHIAGVTGLLSLLLSLLIALVKPEHKAVFWSAGGAGAALISFYAIACFGEVKAAFSARSTRYGANMALMIAVMLGIVAAVNYISVRHKVRWDLNSDKIYTLSDQTVKAIKALKTQIEVKAFFLPEEPEYGRLMDLFESYAYAGKNFTFEFVDYRRKPEMVKTYNVTNTGARIVLKYEGREARVKEATEEALTNGLVKVERAESVKVYFVKGHGEAQPDDKTEKGYSDSAEVLRNEGFEVSTLQMATSEVPADARVVVVAGPEKPLLPVEVKALGDYLGRGGHVLFMAEPETAPGTAELLAGYGIRLGNDYVVDPMSKLFGAGASVPVIQQYSKHDIVKDFQLMTFFPTARSVQAADKPPEGVTMQVIASTGPGAWGETDMAEIRNGKAAFHKDKDLSGPVPVAAASLKKITSGSDPNAESRLVVFGDGEFANNQFRSFSGNGDLFVNAVSWLARQEENISIRPKTRTSSRIFLAQWQADLLKYLTAGPFPPFGIIPMGLFIAAFVIWRSRKNK